MTRKTKSRTIALALLIASTIFGLISMFTDQWVTGEYEGTVFKQDIWGSRWVYDHRIMCARVCSVMMICSAGFALLAIPAEAYLLECHGSMFLKIMSILLTITAFVTNMSMWSCMLDYTRHLVEDSRGTSNVQFGYSLAFAIIACLGFLAAAVITGLLVCMKISEAREAKKGQLQYSEEEPQGDFPEVF